ncbi:hypothetical protein phiOC_p121 [Ochrobactrum phage vB_OspM_OC]|nr:hypothetical protein phiOC_p121 [Ochrobactrum phage vB_OspM_OC]
MESIVEFYLAHFPDEEPLLISENYKPVKEAWEESVKDLPTLKIFFRRIEVKDMTPSKPSNKGE